MKRVWSLLLVILMTIACFAGCGNAAGGAETTVETTEAPEPFVTTTLIENGASDCVIVHDGTLDAKSQANEIRNLITKNFGVTLNVADKSAPEAAKEIVVGNARPIAEKTYKKMTGEFDFAVKVEENKLVIGAKNAISYLWLKEYLANTVFAKTEDGNLVMDSDDNLYYSRSELMAKTYVDLRLDAGASVDVEKIFEFKQYDNQDTKLPYRLYVPFNYDPAKSYPLVVHLHGAGLRGNDNQRQLGGIHKSLLEMKDVEADQAIIVAPQCPEGEKWVDSSWSAGEYSVDSTPESNELKAVVELIGELQKTYNVDAKRIYAIGFSMGGYGTWDLLTRHPDLFAAGMPLCGGADASKATQLAKLPIWAVHGAKDPTVPVKGSQTIVKAIENAGGALIKYTELPDNEHDVWTYAYSNPEMFSWLFQQSK